MEWITIIGFILFGIMLLIAEVIFVPGTTIVGILGVVFSGYGIYLSYSTVGSTAGTLMLIGTLIITFVVMIVAFRGKSWERFSLKGSIQGKFNEDFKPELRVGEKGRSISSLKPIGKALFKDKEIEVRSNGGFITENKEIEIIRIESTKIFVKPLNN